jgi:hypothetical protein
MYDPYHPDKNGVNGDGEEVESGDEEGELEGEGEERR